MDNEKSTLNIEETESESNHSFNGSQKSLKPRRWTSGNFDVIEVFEDEAQLDEWFNSSIGGATDWVM